MKQITALFIPIAIFFACGNPAPAPAETAKVVDISADSTAIAGVIHGFYQWYDKFTVDETKQLNFINEDGPHLTIDQGKMEAYFADFYKTGFVSQAFLTEQYAFYKKCEVLWQNEEKGDVPSGMDADKFFCAQDWEVDFWTKSPVKIQKTGENKAAATLYGTIGDSPLERNFELVKENGNG